MRPVAVVELGALRVRIDEEHPVIGGANRVAGGRFRVA